MTSDQPTVSCGNPRHPSGPWHPATPLPGSWQWVKRWRYRRNTRRYGCGCDVTEPAADTRKDPT